MRSADEDGLEDELEAGLKSDDENDDEDAGDAVTAANEDADGDDNGEDGEDGEDDEDDAGIDFGWLEEGAAVSPAEWFSDDSAGMKESHAGVPESPKAFFSDSSTAVLLCRACMSS
ncbi:hypothetical protein OZX73_00975 [Bifidobacterium sp. ESL0775]|uniref:hypothetical protein n=1 Tax=Bifidobacterium sp. ESL0775 TaxID=2983230 RepID=UPI0023F6200E|nr:hypothetical protein [Bifidobacterium sp. ESL0775]WEV69500.1 hypothetical protein OZX73_00975 [Bifidobacterium sp. ESL0775]